MLSLIHGGDIYSAREHTDVPVLDFSANISPLGLPEGIRRVLLSSLDDCACYPDPLCRELTEALAKSENVAPAQILCGNGASDIIYRLVYAKKPRRALLLAPTFSEYEQALLAGGCALQYHFLKESEDFALTEAILPAITQEVDMLFLCNPNNPTGQAAAPELLCRILERCTATKTLLVLDECFHDFLDDPASYTLKAQLQTHQNLVILRAFTKMYAMAGLRLGYCFCSDRVLLEQMYGCASPWSVSVPAQHAGVQALQEEAYVAHTRSVIQAERAFLKKELTRLGCTLYGSNANYIFFRPHVAGLCKTLQKQNILVRDCGNYRGLSGEFCRIAVKLHADNVRLLRAMEEISLCQ